MNNSVSGVALVEQWRKGRGLNNPAGSLFAAGEFAQADIVNATRSITDCCDCTGSVHTTIHIQCC
jgi:hypothetical protein